MKDVTPRSQRRHSPLVMGVALILIGALLLMINLGFEIPVSLWNYWPLPLIVLGLIGIAAPSRHMSRGGGISVLAAGLYCEISMLHLFDLDWSSAWPIFIMAAGLGVILEPSARGSCFGKADGQGLNKDINADDLGAEGPGHGPTPGPGQTYGQSGR